ncbi:MAG: sigma-70 family RNA polymerase sigma factor [Holophagales bacterium]|nr:sigma-70 family RNA polymerase sigma factor [Holophagales bacterium]
MTEDSSIDRPADVTELLLRWRAGEEQALERLMPIVYDELRRLARGQMRRDSGREILQTTALVHEAYLRLSGRGADWEGREHFFAIAATVMRQVLVDHVRRRTSQKRGGQAEKVSLDEVGAGARLEAAPDIDLLALDRALSQLGAVDPRKSRIVELRFFGGLTIAEAARVLDLSTATVERDLSTAKAWLSQALAG